MRKNFLRGIYLAVVTAGTLALASDHLTVPTVAPEYQDGRLGGNLGVQDPGDDHALQRGRFGNL